MPKHLQVLARDKHRVIFTSLLLDPRFSEAVTENRIPVDLRALRAIKHRPFALDLYWQRTDQAFEGKDERPSPFHNLEAVQFGPRDHVFRSRYRRRAVKAALIKIEAVCLNRAIGERVGGVELLPENLPAIAARRNVPPESRDRSRSTNARGNATPHRACHSLGVKQA